MESNSKTTEIFLGSQNCAVVKESETAGNGNKITGTTEGVNVSESGPVLRENNNLNVSGNTSSEVKNSAPKRTKSRVNKELALLLKDSNFNPSSGQKRKKNQNYNKFLESEKNETDGESEEGSKKKRRKESIDNSINHNASSTSKKQSSSLERKDSLNSSKDLDKKDGFCWYCHREGQFMSCQACPRSFHSKCLDSHCIHFVKNTCPECMAILKAESIKSRSFAMRNMTIDQFCELLKYAIKKVMMCEGSEPFMHPVDATEFPEYCNYIVNPMDISNLEKNIIQTKYGSTEAFIADVKWIVHNSIIFNSVQSKITTYARNILRICKQEMAEIENCYECYLRSNICASDWFVETCTRPHILVWAKLKGFPFWPAKAMSFNDENADVRFFGAHDRAWVPFKECFLYSEKIPSKRLSKTDLFTECLEEVTRHIKKLEEKFGTFCFAPMRTAYNPLLKNQINILLPNYKVEDNNAPSIKDIINKSPKTTQSSSESPKFASKSTESRNVFRNNSLERNTRRSRRSNELIDGYGSDDEDLRNNNSLNLEARKKFITLDNSDSESEHSDKLIIDNSLTNFKDEVLKPVCETEKKKPPVLPKLLTFGSTNAKELDKAPENSLIVKNKTITENEEKPKSIIGKEVVAKLTKTVNGVTNLPKILPKSCSNETKSITKTSPTLVNSKPVTKVVNVSFSNVNGVGTPSIVNKKVVKNVSSNSGPIKYNVTPIKTITIAPSTSTLTVTTPKPKPDDTRPRYATDEIPADCMQTLQFQKKINDIFNKLTNKQLPKSATVTQTNLSETTTNSLPKIIDTAAMKMNFFFKSVATEIVKEISELKSNNNTVKNLENEIESLKKSHDEEISQIKTNVQITIREMYKGWIMEKTKAIEDVKAKCEIEKSQAIANTKTKSWCVNCQKEAQFYCCWNTSYCDYPCQLKHWESHKNTCNRGPVPEKKRKLIKKENVDFDEDSNSMMDQELSKD